MPTPAMAPPMVMLLSWWTTQGAVRQSRVGQRRVGGHAFHLDPALAGVHGQHFVEIPDVEPLFVVAFTVPEQVGGVLVEPQLAGGPPELVGNSLLFLLICCHVAEIARSGAVPEPRRTPGGTGGRFGLVAKCTMLVDNGHSAANDPGAGSIREVRP